MKDIRISIAAIVTFLISIGVVMIYSASGVFALQELGDSTYYLTRHLLFLFIGTLLMLAVMSVDYRLLRKVAKPLLLLTILLLIFVLIPGVGKASFGAQRWFKLGPFHFQPSEFAKLSVLLYMADFLARKQNKIIDFWDGFLPPMCVLGIVCALIVKQPDLGSSVLIASVIMIMMFIAGMRVLYLGLMVVMALPVLYVLIFKVAYRYKRIMSFLDPCADGLGTGFQLCQSYIALGSGGMFGVGLGQSVQKLFYLPAAHTDFILSIIGEELGILGTMSIVILFGAFIWQGARIAKRVTEPFGHYLAIGIVSMLGLQSVVNIGVSIGAFPTKGLPLPFVSYGGSALVFNMIFIGLLLNISRTEDLSSTRG